MSPDLAARFNRKWSHLDQNENSMRKRFFAEAIKLGNWLALTMSYNMSERMRVITLTSAVILVHLNENIGQFSIRTSKKIGRKNVDWRNSIGI